jgi:hypothetical protein
MVYTIFFCLTIGLLLWRQGSRLHSTALLRNKVARFPDPIRKFLARHNIQIDGSGLTSQVFALYVWSYLLVEFKLVNFKDWGAISVQVILFLLIGIVVFTYWGWWRKDEDI